MANVSTPTWNVVPPHRLPGDDSQILIVDREDGPNGRTVCIQSRLLFHNASEYDALYPEAPRPSGFCAPRVEDGYLLEEIRVQLGAMQRSMSAKAA